MGICLGGLSIVILDNWLPYKSGRFNRFDCNTTIEDIRNLFRWEKETNAIKDRILTNIRDLFEHKEEEENYYKPVRVSNFWSNNYAEYESSSDKNKTLSV